MTLTGQHTTNIAAKQVWDMMMDPDILARVTPFITRLERLDEENYKAIADVKIGPVQGSFTGSMKVSDRNEPHNFKLTVQQNSKIGNAQAVVDMQFEPVSPTQTKVNFAGHVMLAGTLAVMGGRVLQPVANLLARQFFTNLEKEINSIPTAISASLKKQRED